MKRLTAHLRNKLLAGALAAVPIALLLYVLVLLEQSAQALLEPLLGVRILGLGVVALLALLYLLGVAVTCLLGWLVKRLRNRLDERLAWGTALYRTWKDVLLPLEEAAAAYRAVVVSFPGEETSLVGLTNREPVPGDPSRCYVFFPGFPNPLAGRLTAVALDRCAPLELPVGEALKFLRSAGGAALDRR